MHCCTFGAVLEFDEDAINTAIDNCSDNNVLGVGGYGTVYKGYLNGCFVAIKKLTVVS